MKREMSRILVYQWYWFYDLLFYFWYLGRLFLYYKNTSIHKRWLFRNFQNSTSQLFKNKKTKTFSNNHSIISSTLEYTIIILYITQTIYPFIFIFYFILSLFGRTNTHTTLTTLHTLLHSPHYTLTTHSTLYTLHNLRKPTVF